MLNLPPTKNRLGQSPQGLLRYFVLVMALVYLGLGLWLLFTADRPTTAAIVAIGPTGRRVLGAVLTLWGLVRLGRGLRTHFFSNNEISNDDD